MPRTEGQALWDSGILTRTEAAVSTKLCSTLEPIPPP
jgi:hypothetical protein